MTLFPGDPAQEEHEIKSAIIAAIWAVTNQVRDIETAADIATARIMRRWEKMKKAHNYSRKAEYYCLSRYGRALTRRASLILAELLPAIR